MADVLVQYDGIPASDLERDVRTPEATGFYKAIRAMIDAGLRIAWEDNSSEGQIAAGAADEAEIVDALAKHSKFTSEFLDDMAELEGAEGKLGVEVAQAAGYRRACRAMADAGFRGVWVDSRRQPIGSSCGWVDRNDI